MKQLIECVPNFSEGRDMNVIKQITDAIESVEGVKLLNVDPGKATNRTVVTFVGEPEQVVEAAFRGIQKAAELIDMSKHSGEHPRMGATDVCPFIPIANISMEETIEYSKQLGQKVGEKLGISIFLYESSATDPRWQNLANIRSGEYEKMASKLSTDDFIPNYGPSVLNETAGVTAIGARDFLIAYNVNLNTTSDRKANAVAFDIRENGKLMRDENGKVVKDEAGNKLRTTGACKGVKGIGWFIEEYGVAQVSMNITNIKDSPLHIVFDECCKSATNHGMRVTGSELVGLVPLQVMIDAGKYFLAKQERSLGVSEDEIIKIAIKSMGLDELSPFDPQKRVIEYMLAAEDQRPLVNMTLSAFATETASESMAPGGGSIAAYVGTLGISLASMVANLSAAKKGWEARWEEFSQWAEKAQAIKKQLLDMVDEDTNSFNGIIQAMRLPKASDAEKAARLEAIQEATKHAVLVPVKVMELSLAAMEIAKAMAVEGNPNSVTDAAVGALCARTAVRGAHLNALINMNDLEDKDFIAAITEKAALIATEAEALEVEVMKITKAKM